MRRGNEAEEDPRYPASSLGIGIEFEIEFEFEFGTATRTSPPR